MIEFASCTDTGRVRARNEDALAIDAARGWAVLADGMGGYHGGDVAARLGVDAVARRLGADLVDGVAVDHTAQALLAAVDEANSEILDAGLVRPELAGMGSTVVVAAFVDASVVSAHVGDSRLYRLRDARLERLTRDHTVLQEQIDGGVITVEDARWSPSRGLLTRALGVDRTVIPDIAVHAAQAGDVFLLCSDGLTDMLDDVEIEHLLGRPGDPAEIARQLVDCANASGGRDNVTVIVARLPV